MLTVILVEILDFYGLECKPMLGLVCLALPYLDEKHISVIYEGAIILNLNGGR
jgi:hypothetical protein